MVDVERWNDIFRGLAPDDKVVTAIKKEEAFLAVGNRELGPFIGKVVECPNCGDLHEVKYGDKIEKDGTLTPSKMLGYVKCNNGKSYLVAIDGKELGEGGDE